MTDEADVRPSPIAGTWYPSNPDLLRQSIQGYLDSVPAKSVNGKISGIIVPHAGHQYSGRTAAAAFKLLDGLKIPLAAVLSPAHRPFPGRLATTAHSAYSTPLGLIPVSSRIHDLRDVLENSFQLELSEVHRDREHSLEIELPFLQLVLGASIELLPIMLADQSIRTARSLGLALAEVLRNEEVIIIASTDLSHFNSQDKAAQFDKEILSRIEAFNPEGVIRAEEEQLGFACGRGAAAAALWACRELGADSVQVLDYSTSGDITGDYSSVVGYGSAVIFREEP